MLSNLFVAMLRVNGRKQMFCMRITSKVKKKAGYYKFHVIKGTINQ